MKILHLASFRGNIGDNASHIGLDFILSQNFKSYTYKKVEMRKFYKNYKAADKKYFNNNFIEEVNKHDLFLFGGGGYFDFTNKKSKTGTYLDINIDLISKIKTPTIFTSIGAFPFNKVTSIQKNKFKNLLDAINQNSNIRVLFRNDGSKTIITKYFGTKYKNKFDYILDNGFFFNLKSNKEQLMIKGNYAVINVTYDQLRFENNRIAKKDIKSFAFRISKLATHLITKFGYKIVFSSHIYHDITTINEIIKLIDDNIVREKIIILPCIQGDKAANFIFGIYKNSNLVIASRLHANICAIALGKKVIGISVLDRVCHLHQSLNSNNYVSFNSDFLRRIIDKIDKITKKRLNENSYLKTLTLEKKNTLKTYRKIFKELKLIR